MQTKWEWVATVAVALNAVAWAGDGFESGSDGSDGSLFALEDRVVDLSLAATGQWDTTTGDSNGVYDPELWAVVFKYTTIDIAEGATVSFANHPSNAPVVWLATGEVNIDGTVDLSGQNGAQPGQPAAFAIPGPGGFGGAVRSNATPFLKGSGGFGPGGGGFQDVVCANPGGGSYFDLGHGTNPGALYGSNTIFPLIGGSGGSANTACQNTGGGAGGGAIVIASDSAIEVNGSVLAKGGTGNSAGSGGAIRLVAPLVHGNGQLNATGEGSTGHGRIRIDADNDQITIGSDPDWTTDFVTCPVFPDTDVPSLKILSVDHVEAPADPVSGILTTDLEIDNDGVVTVEIEASNIPPGTTVTVRVVPARGQDLEVTSTALTGTMASSTATANIPFPPGKSEIQLRANWAP